MVSLITEALSSWDVMAWGRGSIPANSTNSRFSLPRLDRAASRLFSFLSSSIRGLGRLSKKWNRIIYTLSQKFSSFFIERFFIKCVYDACSLHFNEPTFNFFGMVDLIKVRQSRNVFSSWHFFQKTNERIQFYFYDTSGWLVFVCFLEELKTPKSPFEINWHLQRRGINAMCGGLRSRKLGQTTL